MSTTQQRLPWAVGVDGRQWAPYANESITHKHEVKSVIEKSCRSNYDCNRGRGLPVCRSFCWQNELSLDVQQVWKWSSDSRPVPHPLGSLTSSSTQSLSANIITINARTMACYSDYGRDLKTSISLDVFLRFTDARWAECIKLQLPNVWHHSTRYTENACILASLLDSSDKDPRNKK